MIRNGNTYTVLDLFCGGFEDELNYLAVVKANIEKETER